MKNETYSFSSGTLALSLGLSINPILYRVADSPTTRRMDNSAVGLSPQEKSPRLISRWCPESGFQWRTTSRGEQ